MSSKRLKMIQDLLSALNPDVSKLKVNEKHSLIESALYSNEFHNYPAIESCLSSALCHGRHDAIWLATSGLEELLNDTFDVSKNTVLAAEMIASKVSEKFNETYVSNDELTSEQRSVFTNFLQASQAMITLLEDQRESE